MSLISTLTAFANGTKDPMITLLNTENDRLISFNAKGYEHISEDLWNAEVTEIEIHSPNDVMITVQIPDNDPGTDPGTDPDPNNDPGGGD